MRSLSGLIATAAVSACAIIGCSSGSGGSGSGGSTAGTGGSATGGGTATGGAMATGGTASGGASTGGTSGTGGATATGGTAGSGGMTGTGGSSGGAGAPGSGGRAGGAGGSSGGDTGGKGAGGSASGFTLTSPDLAEGAKFAKAFTCDAMNGTFGAGVNPELDWAGVPAGTKSLAITFIDTTIGENMSMGQHWAIWNIPWNATTGVVSKIPQATKTLSGELATAKQSGSYLAPCAQSLMNGMDDQYAFTLYALPSDSLTVSGMSVANVLTALKATTPLGTAKLTGHAGLKGK